MKPKKVVIVEDIESNKIFLENLINENFVDYKVVESFLDGKYAIEYLNKNSGILLFLDIRLLDIHGFELLERVEKKMDVIFVTAYPNYAIDSYEVKNHTVIDFVRKPVKLERLKDALLKYEEKLKADLLWNQTITENILKSDYEKYGDFIRKVGDINNIVYIVKKYRSRDCEIYLNNSAECIIYRSSINDLMDKLPDNFIRISKRDIVNKKHVVINEKKQTVRIMGEKKKISSAYFYSDDNDKS